MQPRNPSARLTQITEKLEVTQFFHFSEISHLKRELIEEKQRLAKLVAENANNTPLLDSTPIIDNLIKKLEKMISTANKTPLEAKEEKVFPGNLLKKLPQDLLIDSMSFLSVCERALLRRVNKNFNNAILKSKITEDFIPIRIQPDIFIIQTRYDKNSSLLFNSFLAKTKKCLQDNKKDIVLEIKNHAKEKTRNDLENSTSQGRYCPTGIVCSLLALANYAALMNLLAYCADKMDPQGANDLMLFGMLTNTLILFFCIYKICKNTACTAHPGERRDITFGLAPYLSGRNAERKAQNEIDKILKM